MAVTWMTCACQQVVERDNVASEPCIVYSTQGVTGPRYRTAAPLKRLKSESKFLPVTQDL